MKLAKIEWSETHDYAAFVLVPDDFDQDAYDMDALAEINTDTNHAGCTDRVVNDITFLDTAPQFAEVEELEWQSHYPTERGTE